MSILDPMLTAANVAEWLSVKPITVCGLIASGQIEAIDIAIQPAEGRPSTSPSGETKGGIDIATRAAKSRHRPNWRIRKSAVEAFLAGRTTSPKIDRPATRRRRRTDVTEFV